MKKIALLLLVCCVSVACESDSDATSNSDNFDKKAMLTHYADNLIIPAYTQLNADLGTMVTAKNTFIATPNATNLAALKLTLENSWKTWQYLEIYNIGLAEQQLYGFQMNVYPTNITDIQNNISNGNYNLETPANNDAVGFPAVDYLINGSAANTNEIVALYTTDAAAVKRKEYLNDLVDRMKFLTQGILTDWTTSYRNTFINSTANNATSALNMLVNDYIFYYEKGLRANKIGIPAGVFSNQPLANRVESLYNPSLSRLLAETALDASQDFFNGKAFNRTTTGPSLATYIQDRSAATNNRINLAATINASYDESRAQLLTLNANLFQQVSTNNTVMTQTFDKLQRTVPLLKVDMLSLLSIPVDFVDADGD